MKNKTNFKNVLKRTLCLALMLTIAISFSKPINVEAKTKTVTVKKLDFTTKASKANKKAIAIKKGSYNVVMNKKNSYSWYRGYLKFTAPQTRTYTITASGLKASDGQFINGHVSPLVYSKYGRDSLTYPSIKTKGGKKTGLHIGSKNSGDALYSRTGKIKLQQGQVCFLYMSLLGSSSSKSCSFSLVIK